MQRKEKAAKGTSHHRAGGMSQTCCFEETLLDRTTSRRAWQAVTEVVEGVICWKMGQECSYYS